MNAVTASQVLPSGVLVATVRYEDGTNDGEYGVRFVNGAVTTIHKTTDALGRTIVEPIRVTKASAPGVYYGVVGVFYEWQEEQNRVVEPEPMTIQASVGVAVSFKVNVTGGWEEDTIRAVLQEKIEGALSGIETMLPEAATDGTNGTFMVTDVYWHNTSTWDIEKA